MTVPAALMLTLWGIAFGITLWGTWYSLKQFGREVAGPDVYPPVSILKPLKGLEDGLAKNLESFFQIDYPDYEILFSIANPSDPVKELVEEFMRKYPRVRTRLILGEVVAGPNPKVNNLIKSYQAACHDSLLISDSNVRVRPDYLKRLVPLMDEGVGIVTAVVAGRHAKGLGGLLEAAYLNTFYARWMMVACAFGHPLVVGKSMFFRRSCADRFGGIQTLARYIAEDYVAGKSMARLGLKVVIMPDPINQFIGHHLFSAFWARHLRWGRIRKSQAPTAFYFEPFLSCLISGVAGAFAFQKMFGGSFALFYLMHLFVWAGCDLLLVRRMESKFKWAQFWVWLLRESLSLPLWMHMACGNTVNWRGSRLKIYSGGLVTARI